jgi:hypothetical protein
MLKVRAYGFGCYQGGSLKKGAFYVPLRRITPPFRVFVPSRRAVSDPRLHVYLRQCNKAHDQCSLQAARMVSTDGFAVSKSLPISNSMLHSTIHSTSALSRSKSSFA